jgi:predicted nicotinamide N-methyase
LDPAAFIAERLPLERPGLVPEILLHTAGPRSGLLELTGRNPSGLAPYWARPWAGGLVLARHVLDHPDLVRGRTVLDLGAGGGIVAVAAALAGAGLVHAVDVDPLAVVAIGLNARANRVEIAAAVGDIAADVPGKVDVVLAGDLFYDARVAGRALEALDRQAAAGRQVFVGDPGRAHLPLDRLEAVAVHPVRDYGSPPGVLTPGTVYRFRSPFAVDP